MGFPPELVAYFSLIAILVYFNWVLRSYFKVTKPVKWLAATMSLGVALVTLPLFIPITWYYDVFYTENGTPVYVFNDKKSMVLSIPLMGGLIIMIFSLVFAMDLAIQYVKGVRWRRR